MVILQLTIQTIFTVGNCEKQNPALSSFMASKVNILLTYTFKLLCKFARYVNPMCDFSFSVRLKI